MLRIRDLTLRIRCRDVSDVYVARNADVGNCISPLRDGRWGPLRVAWVPNTNQLCQLAPTK